MYYKGWSKRSKLNYLLCLLHFSIRKSFDFVLVLFVL